LDFDGYAGAGGSIDARIEHSAGVGGGFLASVEPQIGVHLVTNREKGGLDLERPRAQRSDRFGVGA
jgi:hypothetical protein